MFFHYSPGFLEKIATREGRKTDISTLLVITNDSKNFRFS